MQAITTIGLDIAKSVFQVHGIDAAGQVVMRRQLKRRYVLAFFQKLPACVVGIEACASSHYWSRELQALGTLLGRSSSSGISILRSEPCATRACAAPPLIVCKRSRCRRKLKQIGGAAPNQGLRAAGRISIWPSYDGE